MASARRSDGGLNHGGAIAAATSVAAGEDTALFFGEMSRIMFVDSTRLDDIVALDDAPSSDDGSNNGRPVRPWNSVDIEGGNAPASPRGSGHAFNHTNPLQGTAQGHSPETV